jgi:hypothetical protein
VPLRSAAAFVILILSLFSAFAPVDHSDGAASRCGHLIDRGPALADEEMAYYDELMNELKSGRFKGEHTAELVPPCSSIRPMCRVTAVWFLAIACPCT